MLLPVRQFEIKTNLFDYFSLHINPSCLLVIFVTFFWICSVGRKMPSVLQIWCDGLFRWTCQFWWKEAQAC